MNEMAVPIACRLISQKIKEEQSAHLSDYFFALEVSRGDTPKFVKLESALSRSLFEKQ